MKTFKPGEFHDPWVGLFWRERAGGQYPPKQLYFRIKFPWKVRRYVINNDEIQPDYPRWTIGLWAICDPLTHQFPPESITPKCQS